MLQEDDSVRSDRKRVIPDYTFVHEIEAFDKSKEEDEELKVSRNEFSTLSRPQSVKRFDSAKLKKIKEKTLSNKSYRKTKYFQNKLPNNAHVSPKLKRYTLDHTKRLNHGSLRKTAKK